MEEFRELNNEIGEYLEESTRKALKVLEYSVVNHRVSDSGIDVLAVSRDGNIILAIECLNWCKWSYANSSRLRSLVVNFRKYPNAVRVLLTSFNVLTKKQKVVMRKLGVIPIELDEQLLSSGKREIVKILGVIHSRLLSSEDIPLETREDVLNVVLALNGDSDIIQKEEESIEVDANTLQIGEPKLNSLDVSMDNHISRG